MENISEYRGLSYTASDPGRGNVARSSVFDRIFAHGGLHRQFYIFSAAAQAGLWWLLIVGVVNSGISAFDYLRVLVAMYSRPEAPPEALPSPGPASAAAIAVASGVIVFFWSLPIASLSAWLNRYPQAWAVVAIISGK